MPAYSVNVDQHGVEQAFMPAYSCDKLRALAPEGLRAIYSKSETALKAKGPRTMKKPAAICRRRSLPAPRLRLDVRGSAPSISLACGVLLERFGFPDRSTRERQCGPILCCLFYLSYESPFLLMDSIVNFGIRRFWELPGTLRLSRSGSRQATPGTNPARGP